MPKHTAAEEESSCAFFTPAAIPSDHSEEDVGLFVGNDGDGGGGHGYSSYSNSGSCDCWVDVESPTRAAAAVVVEVESC